MIMEEIFGITLLITVLVAAVVITIIHDILERRK
jgi:hypothetical protein|tara:strand:- start:17737 stop:17838 length:102 start_codon:yes stop_codon:yes gene_type:complete